MSKTQKKYKSHNKDMALEFGENNHHYFKKKKTQLHHKQNKHFENALRSRDLNKMMQYDEQ